MANQDVVAAATAARAALHVDPLWPRAGGWPVLGDEPVDVAIVGIGTHATSISPTRAHETPLAVRTALARFSPFALGTSMDAIRVADAGDALDPDRDEAAATRLMHAATARARLVVALGGDNAATVPAALGAWGDDLPHAGLVTLDAHLDLRDGVSNGSPVRRLIEAGLDPRRIVQIGIQDFANSHAYRARADELGITIVPRDALEGADSASVAADALRIAGDGGGPVHLDVDVDVCDRSVAPACPASVPGGISAWQLRMLVRAFAAEDRVRSIDLAEIDSTTDAPDERTVRLAALCVLEVIAGLAART